MHTKIFSATTIGVDAHLVQVEVDLSFGMIQVSYCRFTQTPAIKESKQRIQAALRNCGFTTPRKT